MIDHPVLTRLAQFGVHLGLERMRAFLGFLGDPHLAVPVIHVAGTNGKGSTVRMLGAILGSAGYTVGEYSSPHLQRVNERIRVDNKDIPDADLAALLDEVDRARVAFAGQDEDVDPQNALTYFEVMTAAAFLYFQRRKLDVAIIEVGLGGRLDATNVVRPCMTAITSIGMDHQDRLGPDVASIASEKAGIIKPGVPVVFGPLPHLAMTVARAAAIDRGAPFYEPGAHYRVQGRGAGFSWAAGDAQLTDLVIGLAGAHQVENAGVAITAARHLPKHLSVTDEAIRRGLRTARNPGRLEQLAPDLLVDCAHNVDGAARLASYLREIPRDKPRTLLLGCSSDKDTRAIVAALASSVDRVLTTRCAHPRAAEPGDLAQQLVGLPVPVLPAGPIEVALPEAMRGPGLVVVAGSVFLAGAVRDILGAR